MTVSEIIKKHGNERENLLAILHQIQAGNDDNSLHKDQLQQLAEIMDIPVADIVSTASFYTMFSLKPRGKHIIRLCESPPCYIMGEENILTALENCLKIKLGETTADKMFTLETTSCLGACGVAPVMMIDDTVYGELTEEKTVAVIKSIVDKE
ncbi:MAG: NAD(P)H-dependent oxidoreductase subunit E [Victivallaceae bacterium]|nr:NAD(P)H-dependent oxidoreductase subunit E [Victivallaceae bacterium]